MPVPGLEPPIRVEAVSLSLDYPVFDSQSQSLRNKVTRFGLGGLVQRDTRVVSVRALDGVSFRLSEGDRLALVGENGSGKSSLLRVLAGIYPPSSGFLRLRGRVSALLSTGLGMEMDATGRENILLCGLAMGVTRQEILGLSPEIAEFSELGTFLDLPVRTYSSGMALRLSFSIASAIAPDILLIDEVIGIGDRKFYEKAQRRLLGLLRQTQVIVMASHDCELLRGFCNKALVLQNGRCMITSDVEDAIALYEKT